MLGGDDAEFDVIAVCCDWTESSADELWGDYSHMGACGELTGRGLEELLEELESRTTVVRLSDSFRVACF